MKRKRVKKKRVKKKPPDKADEPKEAAETISGSPQPDDRAMANEHAAMLCVWDREADRFWVRNNLMLIASGLLLGGAIAVDQTTAIRLLICAFGILFSMAWLLLNNKGGYYVSRWRPVIEMYEAEMAKRPSFPILPLSHVKPDEKALLPSKWYHCFHVLLGYKTPRMDAGDIMHKVIIGFLLAWIGLGISYGLGHKYSVEPEQKENKQNGSLEYSDTLLEGPNSTQTVVQTKNDSAPRGNNPSSLSECAEDLITDPNTPLSPADLNPSFIVRHIDANKATLGDGNQSMLEHVNHANEGVNGCDPNNDESKSDLPGNTTMCGESPQTTLSQETRGIFDE